MIWLANAVLLFSMFLIGRKTFRLGWSINLFGNVVFTAVTAWKAQWDYCSLATAFALVAAWNLWKALRSS